MSKSTCLSASNVKILSMRKSVLSLVIVFLTVTAFSQPGRPGGQNLTGRFYGKVVEAKTGKPIEFASVQLFQNRFDSATKTRREVLVTGMLTSANGDFSLENIPVVGQSILRITVIGYSTHEEKIAFDKPSGNGEGMMTALDKDLGNIRIEIAETQLENVTVQATSRGLRLGIDRKIFSVDKNIVSEGGTAVDVMRNVPSVQVDLDGNVTMRNNSPQIFVDGRPTTMTLEEIPADVIESVEVITNPSAKFDASGGTAGIINVVLKKNRKVGYNGSLRANVDSRARVGLGGNINLRQDKINLFVNGNFNQRKSKSWGTTDRVTFGMPDTLLYQDDNSIMQGHFAFLRTGIDYFIDNRNTLSIAGNFNRGKFEPFSSSLMQTNIEGQPSMSSLQERVSNSERNFRNRGLMLSYKHNFPRAGRELTADITYNKSRNWSSNLIRTDSLDAGSKEALKSFTQRQDGRGANENYIFQLDYINPINDKSKFETGVRMTMGKADTQNEFYGIDAFGNAILRPSLSVNYNSIDKVYAAYGTYSNQMKNFGYQLGLRLESSEYEGRLPDKNQQFNIEFPVSLFPSIFLSQKFEGDHELQLNYSRRINRPNFFQLYPYTDFSDSLNISRGNPDLNPEFTNSFELSYQKIFKKNRDNFLASIYYKHTDDLITRYLFRENNPETGKDIFVNTYINARSSYVTGLEMVAKVKMNKWWETTPEFNLFTSKINIDDPNQPEQEQFASWSAELNNTFRAAKNLTFQLSAEYDSKRILPPGGGGGGGGGFGGMWGQPSDAQGYIRNFELDMGMRYEFLKNRQASLSLNVNDILRTRRQGIYSESEFLVQDIYRRRDPQVVRLSFNWRFGKFDPNLFKRKNQRTPGEEQPDMMMQ